MTTHCVQRNTEGRIETMQKNLALPLYGLFRDELQRRGAHRMTNRVQDVVHGFGPSAARRIPTAERRIGGRSSWRLAFLLDALPSVLPSLEWQC